MTLMKRNRNTFTPEIETFGQFPTTFSDLMDDFFGQSFNARRANGWWRPEMNVSELSDKFEITLALPGINREDVDINLEDHTLIIKGERRWREESDRKPHLVESRFGKFRRSLPLPNTIDTESVAARLDNGVLYITINKQEDKTTQKIDIK